MTDIFESSRPAPRMLIADDDPAIVRIVADRCARVGFEVETATNGIQALIKANRSHPDVMIIDVNMPEADGLSVCARLLDPARRALNVVVITGSHESETIERCDSFGAFYVRKGPGFWAVLAAALIETFPWMARRIKELEVQPMGATANVRPRVLVVDDDPATERNLSSRLGKFGVETLYSGGVPLGVQIARKSGPSVIISEYSMQDGDVHYLLARLRTTCGTENIPVVVLTGQQITDAVAQILKREICGHPGVAHVFRKSYDNDALFGALQKLVGFETAGGTRVFVARQP